jgi:methylmalonyl-CoA mutase C-terminal domain/subunit
MSRPIRVLIAKPGLDGHDRGALTLAMGLRDEGMEVIYTGIRQSVENIVGTCTQEYVDVLGLSLLAGGIISNEDRRFLKEKGVKEIFGPGSSISEIAKFIRENVTGEDS